MNGAHPGMLFLLNETIVEIDLPEAHLARRWRMMGCGEPAGMRAREAVDFVREVIDQSREKGTLIDAQTERDLAALIIAKTGANAIQIVPRISGPGEARLSTIDEPVLEAFRVGQVKMAVLRDQRAAWAWSAA